MMPHPFGDDENSRADELHFRRNCQPETEFLDLFRRKTLKKEEIKLINVIANPWISLVLPEMNKWIGPTVKHVIECIWTLIPALILIQIALPS